MLFTSENRNFENYTFDSCPVKSDLKHTKQCAHHLALCSGYITSNVNVQLFLIFPQFDTTNYSA